MILSYIKRTKIQTFPYFSLVKEIAVKCLDS
jgi:hypothetical protein